MTRRVDKGGGGPNPLSFEALRAFTRPVARLLASLGAGPGAVTVLGCVVSLCAAALFGAGQTRVAGGVMLLGGLFDSLDGALARELGRTSEFGAFLDSTLDRVSEAAILTGLVFAFALSDRPYAALVAGAAMGFSLLTSYTRSRAESLGFECNVGVLGRAGRVVILGVSSLAGAAFFGVVAIAVGASVTTVQRVLHVRRLALVGREGRGNKG